MSNLEDNLQHLRKLLDEFIVTENCIDCDWIDHTDNFINCYQCDSVICENCSQFIKEQEEYFCNSCYIDYQRVKQEINAEYFQEEYYSEEEPNVDVS